MALWLAPSELLLRTHLPTLEGWTVDVAAGLCFAVPMKELEPTWADPTTFKTLHVKHLATPPGLRALSKTMLKCSAGYGNDRSD